jgi:hypothetical protein
VTHDDLAKRALGIAALADPIRRNPLSLGDGSLRIIQTRTLLALARTNEAGQLIIIWVESATHALAHVFGRALGRRRCMVARSRVLLVNDAAWRKCFRARSCSPVRHSRSPATAGSR